MLRFFRKHARGWFMIAIIAIIIIVFVLYFGSSRGSRAASRVHTSEQQSGGEWESEEPEDDADECRR